MADTTNELERKRSYGIGGAGNIRMELSRNSALVGIHLTFFVGSEADFRRKIEEDAEKASNRKLSAARVEQFGD